MGNPQAQLLPATAHATSTQSVPTTPAPAPKLVPTADELLHAQAPIALDSASSTVLLGAAKIGLDEIFAQYKTNLGYALDALAEPPPPPDEGLALKILGAIVEGIAGFALGGLSTFVFDAVKPKLGEAADSVKETLRSLSKEGSKAAGAQAIKSSTSGNVREAKNQLPNYSVNIGAKTLVEQFSAMQKRALDHAHAQAQIRLLLLQDVLQQADHSDVLSLTKALNAFAANSDTFRDFQFHVATAWMNFCASLSLGPKPADQSTMMAGANQPNGVIAAGPEAVTEWRGGHDGFVDITIEVPETIFATVGLGMRRISVEGNPGLARMLRMYDEPLMNVPVYRRVWLSYGSSKLESDPAFVITPEGELEVDVGSGLLAAIAARMPRDARSAANGEVRVGTAAERFMQRSWSEYHAHQGAELVKQWLAYFKTGVIS